MPPPIAQRYVNLGELGYRVYGAGGAEQRLWCFPPVGGHSLTFRALAAALGPEIELCAVDPPGHAFFQGPPRTSVAALVELYRDHLPLGEGPKAHYLGYSLGAYVAHHLAAVAPPASLILAAAPPYHRRGAPYSQLSSPALKNALLDLGGLPPAIAASPELYAHFLPVLRADFAAFEGCAPTELAAPPTLLLGGADDPLARIDQLEEWSRYVALERVERLPGAHFFIDTDLSAFSERLRRWVLQRPV